MAPARRTAEPRLRVRLSAHLELMRLPNLFTAVADTMMGCLLAEGPLDAGPLPARLGLRLGLLVATACLLYAAGMVLNDVVDAPADAAARPQRPIPSGRVGRGSAARFGLILLAAGTAVGWTAGALFASPRTALAVTCLVACIALYDGPLKRTPAGPVALGGCRGLNVLVGMSLAPVSWGPPHYLVATGMGVYTAGITWLARTEAQTSRRDHLVCATLTLWAGLALIAYLPAWHPVRVPIGRWQFFWLALAALITWHALRAVRRPTPAVVQRAVRNAIHALIVIDAALCFATQGMFWALIVLALIVPTLWLGRWFSST